MGYGMKYTKGGFPFKEIETGTDRVSPVSPSPALSGELKDLRGKEEEGPRFNGLINLTPPKKGAIISEQNENESEWNKNDGEEAMRKGFVEEHVSEGSEKSQQLLVKKNNNNLKF